MDQYDGKIAVITGGAGGIGHGLALSCLKEGMKIILADIREKELEEQRTLLTKEVGGEISILVTDVTKEEDVKKLAAFALEKYGRVDMMFNNAGVHFHKSFKLLTDNDWNFILNANLWSTIYGMRIFLPILEKNPEGGNMINTASCGALGFGKTMTHYCASKAAVLLMSGAVQKELQADGSKVLVTVVMPDWVSSNLMKSNEVRPAELKNEIEEQTELDKMVEASFIEHVQMPYETHKAIAGTLSNEECGEIVMQAIKDKKNFIITHSDRQVIPEYMTRQLQSGYIL